MTSLHHFIKDFLFCWICISLVFFANWNPSISRIVTDAKKISTRVIAAIWLRLELVAICSCHVAACFCIWLHGPHLLHIEAWWLSRLSWNRMVLEGVLSNVSATMPLLRLVPYVIVQERHVLCERLLIINISVRTAKLILRTHMYLTVHIPMLIWWLVRIAIILLLFVRKELWS